VGDPDGGELRREPGAHRGRARVAPSRATAALAGALADGLDRPIAADLLAEAIVPFERDAVIRRHFALLGLAA
jgi:hypothetical protein